MMDLSMLLGVAGALGGVGLGAVLTDRSQRALFRESRRSEEKQARESAYVEYLSVYRSFRSYLMTENITVKVVERPDGSSTPVVSGSTRYWRAVATARARLHIIADADTEIFHAAESVKDALDAVAKARATYGPGEIPMATLNRLRQAELEFARVARIDLAD
jgi:hypothetical protein